MISKVVVIGAGNLATQLSLALCESGVKILQVYSRTKESAKELADKLDCSFTTSTKSIVLNADLYIFAVSDKALLPILREMSLPIGPCVHTAGSIAADVFENYAEDYGVFYPLQTFSKQRKVDFTGIPICIESNDECLQAELFEFGNRISKRVHLINSEQRKRLHLAAVFACNFTNHMYSISQKLLNDKGIDFELLQPLIQETAQKILELDPISAQTGPAIRLDKAVMDSHEKQLMDSPDFQKLYSFVSESIYKMHKK